jgi:hypothetical protein
MDPLLFCRTAAEDDMLLTTSDSALMPKPTGMADDEKWLVEMGGVCDELPAVADAADNGEDEDDDLRCETDFLREKDVVGWSTNTSSPWSSSKMST